MSLSAFSAARAFGGRHWKVLSGVVAVAVIAGAGSSVFLLVGRSTSLTVLITDVPSRARASVVVSGPDGFTKHLSFSRTLTVPAGAYRIDGTPQPDGSSRVYPTHEVTDVLVPSGGSRRVVVDYADIVPSTTKVGSAATLNGATVTASAITVPTSNPGVSGFAGGDILAFGQTPETPKGLLVRVTAVTSSGGLTILSVTPAPITAALTRAKIDLVAHFDATPATGLAYESGASSTALISDELGGPIVTTALSKTASVKLSWSPQLPAYAVPLGQDTPLCSGSQAPGVTATVDPTASVALALTATISGSWGFISGPQLSMVLSGSETALAELRANLTGSCSDSVTQTLYDLPPVDLQIGPIPLVIVPEVQLTASFDANLHGAVTVGAKQSITLEGGVSYANGQFHLIHHFSSSAALVGTGSAYATLKVSGGPVLLLSLDDQEAGPNLQVLGDVEAKTSNSVPIAAGVYAGGTAGVGAEVHFFGIDATAGPWGVSWGPVKLWPAARSSSTPSPTASPSNSQSPIASSGPQSISLSHSLIDPGGGGLLDVSCPTSTFCMAVDAHGNVLTWDGVTWSSPRSLAPGHELDGVSCTSPDFCAAISNQLTTAYVPALTFLGTAYLWNGTAWSAPQVVPLGSAGASSLLGISCSGSHFCMTLDASDYAVWNGSSWSGAQPHPFGVSSLSCAASDFCAMVGGNNSSGGDASIWNGTTWSRPSLFSGEGEGLVVVTCPSPSFCLATAGGGATNWTVQWSGGRWNGPSSQGALIGGDVSCTSATFCVSTDGLGPGSLGQLGTGSQSVSAWNGSNWVSATISDVSGPTSVSCVATGSCFVTDMSGNVWQVTVTR